MCEMECFQNFQTKINGIRPLVLKRKEQCSEHVEMVMPINLEPLGDFSQFLPGVCYPVIQILTLFQYKISPFSWRAFKPDPVVLFGMGYHWLF